MAENTDASSQTPWLFFELTTAVTSVARPPSTSAPASKTASFSGTQSQFQVQDSAVSITSGIKRMPITEKPFFCWAKITEKAGSTTTAAGPDRCGACRKRVGMMGFKCRCGTATYCGSHRYPEMHSCNVDFKKIGEEEIAKANPLVRAPKLENMI